MSDWGSWIALLSHPHRMWDIRRRGTQPDRTPDVRYPEKTERQPDRTPDVRYPKKVERQLDRTLDVIYPDKVERWPGRIPDVRHPGGVSDDFRSGGMSYVTRRKRGRLHGQGRGSHVALFSEDPTITTLLCFIYLYLHSYFKANKCYCSKHLLEISKCFQTKIANLI